MATLPPLLREWRIWRNENQTIERLCRFQGLQALARERKVVDTDKDGVGEYAYLAELTHAVDGYRCSGIGYLANLPAEAPGLAENRGTAHVDGYMIRVYLPSASGSAVGESLDYTPHPEDADLQEEGFAIYAWPAEVGVTGERAFVVLANDWVYSTRNKGNQNYSGLTNFPAAAAAFSPLGKRPQNLQGRIDPSHAAVDGFSWESTLH